MATPPSAPVITSPPLAWFPNTLEYAWQPPLSQGSAPITGYRLTLNPGNVAYTLPANAIYYKLEGLTNALTYQTTIEATNDGGATYGPPANFMDFQTGSPPSLAPSTVTAVSVLPDRATVSWTAPLSLPDATIFWYYITGVSSNAADPMISTNAWALSQSNVFVTGLNSNSQYYFNVQAVNCPGYSPALSTNTITWVSLPTSLMNINFNDGNIYGLVNYNGANLNSSTPSGTGFSYTIPVPNLLRQPISISATNTFTFAASVYRTGATDYSGIIFTRTTGPATGINSYSSTERIAYHWNDENAGDNWNSGYTVPLNTWTHIVLVIAPTTATLYVNGALTATRTGASHAAIAMTDLYLGVDPVFGGNSRTWTGRVDNLAVYNKILTAEEVSLVYNATLTG